jgi:hypothetical protein
VREDKLPKKVLTCNITRATGESVPNEIRWGGIGRNGEGSKDGNNEDFHVSRTKRSVEFVIVMIKNGCENVKL